MGIFNTFANVQDKTLTGSWKPMTLFMYMFLIVVGVLLINASVKKMEYKLDRFLMIGVQVALLAVFINFISDNLFNTREKMYKKKGFSRQRSKAQAYSDARIGQVLTMMM